VEEARGGAGRTATTVMTIDIVYARERTNTFVDVVSAWTTTTKKVINTAATAAGSI
jgi:hypothetical protein